MTGFLPLLKKEIIEQWRSYRLLIAASVFLLFGISTPLTLKYMPEILKSLASEFPIEMPPPTAAQSLAEFTGTIGQVGILIVVLVAMGAVANEMRRSTGVMTLSKPVSYAAFIMAKFAAIGLTFIVSLAVSGAICFAYTVWLIGGASPAVFTGMSLLLAGFMLWSLAVTLLFSSLFKNSVAAGGAALGSIIAISALSAIPVVGEYLPGALLKWGNDLLAGTGEVYWWGLGVTAGLTVLCLLLTPRVLRRKEL